MSPRSPETRSPTLEMTAPAVRSARPPILRTAIFEDYSQIAALESRFGLEVKSYEQWSHLWLKNPVYRHLQRDWPIGWAFSRT